jgi:UDP-3-O-[3-hydroxymyristoyl] glucosamine N-acyltransferase
MSSSFSLKELAEFLQAECYGDPQVRVDSIASLVLAEPNQLSFLSKKQFVRHLDDTRAGIVILKQDQPAPGHLNLLRVADPYLAYAQVSSLFCQRAPPKTGVHPSAQVDASALIADSAFIGPNCVIGADVSIGENTEIQAGVVIGSGSCLGAGCIMYPNVVIYHGVTIGNRVKVHACSVIGSDGFGYARSPEGWAKIYQLGGVCIGNDVEIGASTTVDRGALDDTVIEDGVIIDNQVHIAHNCRIGKRTAIAGCTGIAGSTSIGADCTIGGMVGMGGHLTIGDKVHFNGSTVVTRSVAEAGLYGSGTVMQEVKTWRKNAVRFGQLEEWVERIKKLEQGG